MLRLFCVRARSPKSGFASNSSVTRSVLCLRGHGTMAGGAREAHETPELLDIAKKPADKQFIFHDGTRYTTIREGLAHILVPASSGPEPTTKTPAPAEPQSVFYNPIQQFNRDLSVLAIKAHGKETVEKRMKQLQKRLGHFADKKRKRQERREQREEQLGRPTKMGKLEVPDKNGDDGSGLSPEAAAAKLSPVPSVSPAPPQIDADGVPPEPTAEQDAATPGLETAHAEGESETSTTAPPAGASDGDASARKKAPSIKILDALSATGLRALRYAHELPFLTMVTSNDLSDAAVKSIQLNVRHNRLEDKIVVTKGNALSHMYSLIAEDLSRAAAATGRAAKHNSQPPRTEKYDVIDLDPFGTAATFFDAAVQAIRDDGGLLCVTCTDAGVWATNSYPEKAFALYGGVPIKGFHSHEVGLRLILHGISSSAARYGLAIEPLLSLSIDYYCRVFVRIAKSPASVKFQAGKTMMVYNCDAGCGAWQTQLLVRNKPTRNKNGSGIFYKHGFAQGPTADRTCEHCNQRMHIAGPMYAGRLHSAEFIQSILDDLPSVSTDVYGTTGRIRGMLVTALEELMDRAPTSPTTEAAKSGDDAGAEGVKDDVSPQASLAVIEPYPFFFNPSMLAKVIHCETPDEDSLKGALRHLGYRVTRSHCKPASLKTDAPWSAIWDVMRAWARRRPVREDNFKPGSAGYHIMGMTHGKAEDGVAPNEAQDEAGVGQESAEGQAKSHSAAAAPREIVFDAKLGRDKNKEKLVRYQLNPRENWGPMSKSAKPS